MILDGLPLEVVKEVLLDLPEVDIIQTVKCTRRLDNFAKADKALSRRLQNRIFALHLRLDNTLCTCGKPVLPYYLGTEFRRANDAAQWNNSSFFFQFEGECKCIELYDRTQEIEPGLLDYPSFLYDNHLLRGFENETKFIIKNDSLDDVVINCAKLFNILMKFCIVRRIKLHLHNSDGYKWKKMSAFFNTNPPDVRIQPYAIIDSRINLDSFNIFPNGLAEITIYKDFGPILADPYHEVLRRTPNISFFDLDLPYTCKDLFGFFKDTKKLILWSATRITKQQACQLVQHFYEVKQDERILEIKFYEDFLVKDFLTLIPEEAYRLHLKRSGNIGPEPENMIWAEMTDRFGGAWALMEMGMYYGWGASENRLRICSMEVLHRAQSI
ncbi:hypothetical protein WR25_15624 [Diploscapter pachys]|uniref:F-box domain-containing protein n=1 Tax=Diploscapter pachys TaxID=2018661 RepID=A0A2A2M050_9BILA|nr:hypothetical protein WR25_15624 [Diploscapter pachys]